MIYLVKINFKNDRLCFCCSREGVVGLYKGMTPYLVHVMPNICLVFLIYETIANR